MAPSTGVSSTVYSKQTNMNPLIPSDQKILYALWWSTGSLWYNSRYIHVYIEHQWKVTTDSHKQNMGALLILSGQRITVTSAFIFVVHSPMSRHYRKWYSSQMNAWQPFANERQLFPLSCVQSFKVVVVHESLSLAFFIWLNHWNQFDGIFKEYLSGIPWNVWFFYLGFCHGFSELVPANTLTYLAGVRH